jgi:hypothetical protein
VAHWTSSELPTCTPEGWTVSQIAAELGLTETMVSDQLRRDGVTLRRSGPPAHSASTEQIVALRNQGLTWRQVAEWVDMTISGTGAHTAGGPVTRVRTTGRQPVLADALDQNLAVRVRAAVADHLGRAPTRASSFSHHSGSVLVSPHTWLEVRPRSRSTVRNGWPS